MSNTVLWLKFKHKLALTFQSKHKNSVILNINHLIEMCESFHFSKENRKQILAVYIKLNSSQYKYIYMQI